MGTSPVVQQAWDSGRALAVHGLVYSLDDGLLKTLYSASHVAARAPGCLRCCSLGGVVAAFQTAGVAVLTSICRSRVHLARLYPSCLS